jgi:FkbH-like protein
LSDPAIYLDSAPRYVRSEPGLGALSERFDWQAALFAPEPERAALLALHASWPLATRRIRIHRNHSIESALTVLRPYLEYSGIGPEFVVSDYDDSLSFTLAGPADVEVIWLDYTRFNDRLRPSEVAAWVGTRVAELRSRTSAPVLVLDWDGAADGAAPFAAQFQESTRALGGVHLGDRLDLFSAHGERYFDPERVSITGTRMSRQAAIATARLLGSWLTALLEPRLKAVVVDLDNTLYDGVIGEDGIEAVELTDGHAELQRRLLELRDSGVFLGVVSRNEPADVRALFESRVDFPLRWEDFSAHRIGWQLKSTGIASIAQTLRIDAGAVLFVDDNIGELLEAMQSVPRLRCLHAHRNADRTVAALHHFPGLRTFSSGVEDGLRIADLSANDERDRALALAGEDLGSYYRELDVRLTVDQHPDQTLTRMAELSRKTNQFNLAIRRFGEPDLRPLMADSNWQLSTARLEDRLTDSGVIAIAVLERQDQQLVVHELCVSCRAFGRRLEDLIVAQLLVSGPLFDGTTEVVFRFLDGPRNGPARTWLSRFARVTIPAAESEPIDVAVPAGRVSEASVNPYITIEVQP